MVKCLYLVISGVNVDGKKLWAKHMDVFLHEIDGDITKLNSKACIDEAIVRVLPILHIEFFNG
jgi:hypothetical protein